jgi:hypothetical protein
VVHSDDKVLIPCLHSLPPRAMLQLLPGYLQRAMTQFQFMDLRSGLHKGLKQVMMMTFLFGAVDSLMCTHPIPEQTTTLLFSCLQGVAKGLPVMAIKMKTFYFPSLLRSRPAPQAGGCDRCPLGYGSYRSSCPSYASRNAASHSEGLQTSNAANGSN